jgi:hypothetical protein
MKTMFLWTLVVVLASSAHAACGGGGWKSSRSSTNDTDHHMPEKPSTGSSASTSRSTTTSSSSTSRTTTQEVRYQPATQAAVPAPVAISFDTSKFDTNSSKLQLSEDQWKQISRAKVDIRKQIDKLTKEEDKARNKYNNCTGDCEDERNKLVRSGNALRSYDAQREFEARLRSILQERQLQTLKSL